MANVESATTVRGSAVEAYFVYASSNASQVWTFSTALLEQDDERRYAVADSPTGNYATERSLLSSKAQLGE